MDKLLITQIGHAAREIDIDKERLTIGRDAGNDLSLDDKFISAHHAVIISIIGEAFMEDLGSTNGTRVNGRPVAKCPLADGDVIEIGAYVIRYAASQGAKDASNAKTELFLPPLAAPLAPRQTAGVAAGVAAQSRLGGDKLQILDGVDAGRALNLTNKLTPLGKPGGELAAISRRADGYYLLNMSAADTPPPIVNGARLEGTALKLKPGDVVELSGVRMRFSGAGS